MPEMDGVEATRHLTGPGVAKLTKIVILTTLRATDPSKVCSVFRRNRQRGLLPPPVHRG